jgi:2,5-diketo-D-gluconate reductase B
MTADGALGPPAGAASIPRLGLGTYGRTGEEGFAAILLALELGYRHLDTAQTYGTESLIGRALADLRTPRSEVFITTKVADTHLARRDFLPSVRASLDRLAVAQVDLLLVHWPAYRDAVPFEEYIDALAEARSLGLTRLIGVSNFPIALIDRAVDRLGPGQLATNQVECHPFLQNRRLRDVCRARGIVTTAYMPLAVGQVMREPVLAGIGERHGESAATVTLAWLFARGAVAIPASARREHLLANRRALTLRLDDDELAAIDALDRGERIVNPAKSPAWD